ncbi:MAG: acyl-CoA reductase [Bacteroidota bacterium]
MGHNILYLSSFVKLGSFLNIFCEAEKDTTDPWNSKLEKVIEEAGVHNPWFTRDNVNYVLAYWGRQLSEKNITQWLSPYTLPNQELPKQIAVIMAGNIPLVGFHDFLCVLFSGNTVVAKLSSNDRVVLPFLTEYLKAMDPGLEDRIFFTQGKLNDFDAVIATGSNNTGRYFDYYFGKYPNLIRKNRNSVAVLSGNEKQESLRLLGEDLFRYFGLGCRSVSKIYVPEDYDFTPLFKAILPWESLLQSNKYANNYEYNRAVYLLSDFDVLDNGFLILKEDTGIASPIGVLYFEYYKDPEQLKQQLLAASNTIQCIVAENFTPNKVALGQTQLPALKDYADGVDTMAFLLKLA